MKNIIYFAVIITAVVFASCEDKAFTNEQKSSEIEKLDVDLDNAFNNSIGFIDEKGNFTSIKQEEMNYFLKQSFNFDRDVNFKEYKIILKVDSLDNNHYFLQTISNEAGIGISIMNKLEYIHDANTGNFSFALNQKTCSCKSISCAANWGCEADISLNGHCTCSICDGDCEKTSMIVQGYYSKEQFRSIIK